MDYTAIIVACISLIGVIVSPIITANLAAKKQKAENEKEQRERDKKQDRIFSMILGSTLKPLCYHALEQGEIDHESLEHIHELYHAYKDLGGNGYMDSLIVRVNNLPIHN